MEKMRGQHFAGVLSNASHSAIGNRVMLKSPQVINIECIRRKQEIVLTQHSHRKVMQDLLAPLSAHPKMNCVELH